MGASEDEEGGGGGGIGTDWGVGTIVWVRRRNGSWWPGRILGQHELSASHLMSPRSGTPVKLLGREDASVDWYNLEKSKRVKAFRCGEFDACIEKAEASQGIPIKKREKYARREDAILHALELEKQSLERQQLPLGSSSSNERSGFLQKEFNTRSSFGRQLNIQKVNHAKMLKCEDDIAEATHRMRGLRDFGLRTAPPKRKFDVAGASESSQSSLLFDSQMLALPDPWQCVEEMNYVPGTKNSLSFKEKKSEGSLLDDSLGKRRDKRHPLVQVLQSSANVSMPKSFSPSNYETDLLGGQDEKYFSGAIRNSKKCKYHYPPANSSEFWDHTSYDSDQMQMPPIQFDYPGSLVEEYTSSGFIEMDESDSSERDYLNPDLEEAEMLLPGNQPVFSRSSDLGRYEEDCSQPFYLKENYGSPNYGEMQSGHISSLHPGDQIKGTSTDTGISKWHVKGKRNIRLTKRMMEAVNGSSMNGFMNGVRYDRKTGATNISREGPLRCGSYSKFDGFDENEHTEKDEDYLLVRNGNSRYSSMLKGTSKFYRDDDASDSDEDSIGISPYDWEADGAHASQRMYQEEPRGRFHSTYSSRHGDGLEPMLIDVDLKVQASYQGERVPLVSLMSKLNGKAIIGHPVQIEKLDDGSTDALLYRDGPGQIHAAADENLEPRFHQTSKGAAFQHFRHSVPISPALDWKQPVNSLDLESKSVYRKPYPVQLNHQPKSMKMSKSVYRKPFPVQLNHQPKSMKMRSHDRKRTQRKHKKRSSKKATSSNQKTRTLSSFAAEQKLGIQNRKHCSVLDGLIKPGDTVPIVTCVPVKVVFSRLLEAVGRPPAPTHRTILRGSVNEKPL